MQSGQLTRAAVTPLPVSTAGRIVFWTAAFTVSTALAAQVRIPLPGTPVPITLQTFFVLLAGLMLGRTWGAVSMGGYLLLGMVGLPIFSSGGAGTAHLLGATGGYLLAYPAAVYLTGWLAGPEPSRTRSLVVLTGTSLFILVGGTIWLAIVGRMPLTTAAAMGMLPFLVGDVVKVVAAAEIGRRVGRRL